MASGDESKWPRQGLTSNKSSLAPRKNAQLCNIYCCLLRKHIMRNCIHNAAKLLKTLCPPILLSSPPPVCSSPPRHLLPKAENCSPSPHPPPLRLGSPCLLPSSLLGCLCHSQSLCACPPRQACQQPCSWSPLPRAARCRPRNRYPSKEGKQMGLFLIPSCLQGK